jgi:predicted TIM-barrel fold metal-dependent hydrolase
MRCQSVALEISYIRQMNRRNYISLLSAAIFARAFASDAEAIQSAQTHQAQRTLQTEGYRSTLRQFIKSGTLPIIDVEHHWGTGRGVAAFPIGQLIEKMDRQGVALTWLGVNESMGNSASLAETAKAPSRLVPTIMHGDGPRWHGRDRSLLRDIDADARSGKYWAMGEFEARHYVSSTNNRDIHTPLDSEGFEIVFKASADTGLPFLIHHEAEDALLPELEAMLVKYPHAKVIWCHVGRNRDPIKWIRFPTPDGVRSFIAQYPNLHFDILQSGPMSTFPPRSALGTFDSAMYEQRAGSPQLKPEWKKLFADHPDRFLIGSDINTGRWTNYNQVFSRLRLALLESLPPVAAELIAYQNAWRLMTNEKWIQ